MSKPAGRATGTITVTSYTPTPYEQPENGVSLVEIHVTEEFAGDLQGTGVVRFLQALGADGSASFCGIERFSGALGGMHGTFLLQDSGTVDGQSVRGTWFVVPGSGTGELTGLRGDGGFEADLGAGAHVWLDYRFE